MYILTKEEMYQADDYSIHTLGMPGLLLMENAGRRMADRIARLVARNDSVVLLVGAGNNGGDGLVIGRYLHQLGYQIDVFLVPPLEKLRGDARRQIDIYTAHGFSIAPFSHESFQRIQEADWVIDALLGIGMQGELKSPYREIILAVNQSNASVISVDIPSGVLADEATVTLAIKADVTLAAAYPKMSAYLYPAAFHYGKLYVEEIGIPQQAVPQSARSRVLWGWNEFISTFPKRRADSHKGRQGRGLIIGGSDTMHGAPLLTAKGCMLSGIGLLSLAIPKEVRAGAVAVLPEATYLSCVEKDGCLADLSLTQNYDVIVAGMGLSRDPLIENLIQKLLSVETTLILDADALFFLKDFLDDLKKRRHPTILTPHAGEMACLCGLTIQEVMEKRFAVSKKFACQYGVYLLLKGPFSILTTPEGEQFVNQSGNAGLAKGGSGDLLSGMIGAFAARSNHLQQAVSNAVFAHGRAAERLIDAGHSQRDITASMVADFLPAVYHQAEKKEQ